MNKKETNIHILLVEDESGHIELIRRSLEGTPGKFIIAVASTIQEAQLLVAKQTPDLALVDYRLPDGQGDLIIALGKDSFPVVMLTSHGDEQLAVQAIKAGALDYVAKSPESFETLPHLLESALREWQLIQTGKASEEALRVSETHFRALFENASDGIMYVSSNAKIVQINNSFAKMHGYTVDEMNNMNLQDLDVDDISTLLSERMKRIINGEELRFEVKHYHKDGHIIDLEVVTSMVTAKTENLIVAFHRDITERKRSEFAIAKFKQAIDTAGEAIFLTDSEGIFTYINPGFTALYGYTSNEVIGKKTPRILKSGLLSAEVYKNFWKIITSKQEVKGEILNKRKDGSLVTIDGSASSILDNENNIVGYLGIQRDITERKKAEIEMEQTLSILESTMESTADGILVADGNGKIVRFNEKFKKMWGIPESIISAKDDNAAISFVLDQLKEPELFIKTVRDLYSMPEKISFDILELMDGRVFERFSQPQRINKLVVGRTWSFRDITERRRSEEALEKSEALYRQLIETMPDGVYKSSHDGKFIEINPAMVKILGYDSKEELLAIDIKTQLYFKEGDRESVTLDEELNERSVYRLRKKDGSEVWVEDQGRLILDDKENILFHEGVIRDVTERKIAEETLRMNDLKHGKMVSNIGDVIVIIDQDGINRYKSPNVEKWFGWKPEELVGFNIGKTVHPEDLEFAQKFIGNLMREPNASRTAEIRYLCKDGTYKWIEFTGVNLLHDPDIRGVLGNYQDITERKKTEETLRQSQKMDSIGTLAGGIAHDFNNLLVGILGQSGLALKKIPTDSPAAGNIKKSISASERAADLVRQLLAYSGKGKFFTVEIDLNNLVKENINMLEISIPKTTQLRYELCSPSIYMIGDISQIQQVIMNLIINAGEAMGTNPGFITVRTSRIELTENNKEYSKYTNTSLAAGSYALLQIKDTGSGINQEMLALIFDPFFTTKFTGRGLGLSAVLGIIKGHYGGLRIETEVGKGTMFEIVWPLIEPSKKTDIPEKKEIAVVGGEGKTILVIDDDPIVFQLLEDVLSEVNFNVIGASDPLEGIELYRKEFQNIAMVILDFSMPNMNGKDAFEKLLQINNDVMVLLCSGYPEADTLSEFGKVKPAGFFQKPYDTDTLVQWVANILSDKKTIN